MPTEQTKQILDDLHHRADHKYRHFDQEFGDPWSGYTRNGFEITYYPTTNSYTWETLCEHSLAGWYHFNPVAISEADLITRLDTINY